MTHQEIIELLEKSGLPFAYDHFVEGESPKPPFLVFLYPNSSNFVADGKVYFKKRKVNVELYTDLKEVEAVLDECGLFYEKSEVWIESENLYEVLYQMEV